MYEVFLLEKDYREAFLYLLYEINGAKLCLENKRPWFPQDEEKFEKKVRPATYDKAMWLSKNRIGIRLQQNPAKFK
jgi:hypothetical protein